MLDFNTKNKILTKNISRDLRMIEFCVCFI